MYFSSYEGLKLQEKVIIQRNAQYKLVKIYTSPYS